ncbi:hypothetical protein [Thalassotalea sediminis]|uniref:hypothetical protein n=1 Tax=Thalassotalea sediminis TaxID=1759089 RepID=UPI002573E1D8|nr:hypothetical protein [Thalassotalea sediminis]
MTRQEQVNSREKSLSENIVIITLVACLMSVFIYYFFKQEDNFTKANFTAAASTFASRVTAIRAQWFMENQPQIVNVKKEGLKIAVNDKGWVDFQGAQGNCIKVWRAVMKTELTFMNNPVAVLELMQTSPTSQRRCRFQLASGEYFDYALQTGMVSNISIAK